MRATPTVAISTQGFANYVTNTNTNVNWALTPNQTWWTATGISGLIGSQTNLTSGMPFGFDYTASAEL
jgi:hypothetical protein